MLPRAGEEGACNCQADSSLSRRALLCREFCCALVLVMTKHPRGSAQMEQAQPQAPAAVAAVVAPAAVAAAAATLAGCWRAGVPEAAQGQHPSRRWTTSRLLARSSPPFQRQRWRRRAQAMPRLPQACSTARPAWRWRIAAATRIGQRERRKLMRLPLPGMRRRRITWMQHCRRRCRIGPRKEAPARLAASPLESWPKAVSSGLAEAGTVTVVGASSAAWTQMVSWWRAAAQALCPSASSLLPPHQSQPGRLPQHLKPRPAAESYHPRRLISAHT